MRPNNQWSEWRRADTVCRFVCCGPPPSLTSVVRCYACPTRTTFSLVSIPRNRARSIPRGRELLAPQQWCGAVDNRGAHPLRYSVLPVGLAVLHLPLFAHRTQRCCGVGYVSMVRHCAMDDSRPTPGFMAATETCPCHTSHLTLRRSRQPPTILFAVAVGDSLLPGFVVAQSPAAAAQLSVKQPHL